MYLRNFIETGAHGGEERYGHPRPFVSSPGNLPAGIKLPLSCTVYNFSTSKLKSVRDGRETRVYRATIPTYVKFQICTVPTRFSESLKSYV